MQKSQEERKEAQKLVTKLEEKLGAKLLSEKVSQLAICRDLDLEVVPLAILIAG